LREVAFVDHSALKNETVKQKEIVPPEQSAEKKDNLIEVWYNEKEK